MQTPAPSRTAVLPTSYSSTQTPTDGDSVLFATILKVEEGPDYQGQKTMVITIDQGSEDGVYNGLRGLVNPHPALFMDYVVISVSQETATMTGWYSSEIGPGDKVVLNLGNLSDSELLEYFK